MIRDDDLAWARRMLEHGGMLTEVQVLARLVLHVHEQDTEAKPAEAEVERLRAALRKISEWDMLNPPQTHVVSDLDWLRRLVDDALTAAGKDTDE